MDRKPIKLKNEIKNMTLEEVLKQFQKFIYKVCQPWKLKYELDDLSQVAFMGLNKAYENYDIKKDVLFLTYAAMIINNEIRMYHRKNKKHENNISMSTTFQFKDNDNLELGDTLQDDINYEDVAVTNIECEKLKISMQKLSQSEQKIIEAVHFGYKSQKEIAHELNLSQSIVSRKYRKALSKLKNIMEGRNMPKPKITRDQLIEEVRNLGTSKEATIKIGKKYGLSPATIRTYFDSMDVRKEGKKSNTKICKSKENNEVENKTSVLTTIYKGSIGEYEVLDEMINIKSKDNSISVMKDNVLDLILELQELSKILL